MSEAPDVKFINSNRYWDDRFRENWDDSDGPAQSRFFSSVAINHLPSWLFRAIRSEMLSVVDWGCAEGDGTDALSEVVHKNLLTGVDFSEVAIEIAKERYAGICFKAEDWLAEENSSEYEAFDVIFSSNTLEHFHRPDKVFNVLAARAKKALIFALPYREHERVSEHFTTFSPDNIPVDLDDRFSLVYSVVVDCARMAGTQWPGEQIILVYLDKEWREQNKLVLSEVRLEVDDYTSRLDQLNEKIEILQSVDQKRTQESELLKAQITELNSKLSYFSDVEDRYKDILDSRSWKVTKPLRSIMSLIFKQKRRFYLFVRWLYWQLPVGVQQRLQRKRHQFVRSFRTGKWGNAPSAIPVGSSDLSWAEFKDRVLSHSNKYKGIFIQEVVIDWNVPLYQRPQHISVALGRQGYLVIYRTVNWTNDNVSGFREVENNVWITDRPEVDQIEGALRSVYSTAYAQSPKAIQQLRKGNRFVYEYIDHIDHEISGDDENVRRLTELKHFAFSGNVDYIVASAKKLYDEAVKAVGEEKVVMVPNGVDTRHYRDQKHLEYILPENVVAFRNRYKNVIGYFGALAPWLWYEAITELVDNRRDLGFIFIGPDYYNGTQSLPRRDNVLYLGAVDYKVLPAYARQFDICFIPFKPGDIAKSTSPLKLFEYFALEKPVVVTSDMDECIKYREVFKGSDAHGLSEAFDVAISVKDDSKFRSRMSDLADQNDWDERAKALAKCFEQSSDLEG